MDLETPLSFFKRLERDRYAFLLESVEGGEKWGRYSILGSRPQSVFIARGGKCELHERGLNGGEGFKVTALAGDPVTELGKLLKSHQAVPLPGLPPVSPLICYEVIFPGAVTGSDRPGWLINVIMRYWMSGGMPTRANYPEGMTEKFTHVSTAERKTKNDSLSWDDLGVLRDMWPGKLLVKGILTPRDAERAIARGADGIIVSNHGGRQLDHSLGTLDMLPEIVEVIGGRVPVIVDGSVSRGSDIVKALALGASAVAVGRLQAYALAAAGVEGAIQLLTILETELRTTMALLGVTTIDQINKDYLKRVAPPAHAQGPFPHLPKHIRI